MLRAFAMNNEWSIDTSCFISFSHCVFLLSPPPPPLSPCLQVNLLTSGGWPLDSYIFDMQWHMTPDWGGYTWDPTRYGAPAQVSALLQSLHDIGLMTGMNLHDDDGMRGCAELHVFFGALCIPDCAHVACCIVQCVA